MGNLMIAWMNIRLSRAPGAPRATHAALAALLAASAGLAGCGSGQPVDGRAPAGSRPARGQAPPAQATSRPKSDACVRAAGLRAHMKVLLDAGRLHRAARAAEQADFLCPETRQETIAEQVEALVALGEHERAKRAAKFASEPRAKARAEIAVKQIAAAEEALRRTSPADLVRQGQDAKRANRPVEAQRLFDRAIALSLRKNNAALTPLVSSGVGRKRITSAGFSPDGKAILVARGREVTWFDAASGLETAWLTASPGFSQFVVPEAGRWGLEISERGAARAIDLEARAPGPPLESLPLVTEFEDKPYPVALSRDGSRAAMGFRSPKGHVRVWETATGRLVATLDPGEYRIYGALRFSPDGALIAGGGSSGELDAWSIWARTGAQAPGLPGEPAQSTSSWLPKDLRASQPDATQMLDRRIEDLDWSAAGTELFTVWSASLHVYKLPLRPGVGPAMNLARPKASVRLVRLSRDGSALLGAKLEDDAGIWDVKTRAYLGEVKLPPGWVDAIVPGPGAGEFTVMAGGGVGVVDRSLGAPRVLVSALERRSFSRVGFSADGARIFVDAGRAFPPGEGVKLPAEDTWEAQEKALQEQFGLRVEWGGMVRDPTAAGGPAGVVASCDRSVAWASASRAGTMLALVCRDEDEEWEVRLFRLTGRGGYVATIRAFTKPDAAYVTTPDGRIEFLGAGAEAALRSRAVCRAGGTTFPFEVCEGWAHAPGLLQEVLAEGGAAGR
jgi:hypothetical protein